MRNKNGFTLVELLVTISLLAVIGTIIIYNTVGLSEETKELQFERMSQIVQDATKTYVSLYPEQFSDLYTYRAYTYITLDKVIDAGLLDEDTENPYTEEKIDRNEEIKIYVDGETGELVYIYPVTPEDRNTEIWLSTSTISAEIKKNAKKAYVNIYDGIEISAKNTAHPSLDLGLVNESGLLIDDYSNHGYDDIVSYYKEYYGFKVEFESSYFRECDKKNSKYICALGGGSTYEAVIHEFSKFYVIEQAGTYKITYSWIIPETGQKRKKTRLVRVINGNSKNETGESTDLDDDVVEDDPANQYTAIEKYNVKSRTSETVIPYHKNTFDNTGVKILDKNRNFTIVMTATQRSKATPESQQTFIHAYSLTSPNGGIKLVDEGKDNGSACPESEAGILSNMILKSGAAQQIFCTYNNKPWRMVIYRNISDSNYVRYGYCSDYNVISSKCNVGLQEGLFQYTFFQDDSINVFLGGSNDYDVYKYMDADVYDFKVYYGYDVGLKEIELMDKH